MPANWFTGFTRCHKNKGSWKTLTSSPEYLLELRQSFSIFFFLVEKGISNPLPCCVPSVYHQIVAGHIARSIGRQIDDRAS